MRELALFAGAGGGILGGKLLGWSTVCAVEIDAYARSVLLARQRDGMLLRFPVWDDVRTFDGRGWRGCVDVVTGGFPCQDISVAGKGAGIDGEQSGLWGEMARIVGEVRPRYVFVENSPALLTRGLGRVLGDLAALGYDCRWTVLGAADVGAPHQRDRFWLVADSGIGRCGRADSREIQQSRRTEVECSSENVADATLFAERKQAAQADTVSGSWNSRPEFGGGSWWESEPDVGRVASRVASRVDRLKALGNGQVPLVAATAWQLLTA